ncbi:MAG: BolA family transcriptional regulator [Lentisphaeraceae bacterium]|nr:BolA family transcriptional regulator [Lentisphaeraceae bacterium]
MTKTEEEIRSILEQEFQPAFMEVVDESHLHAGHMEAKEGAATHFRVTIVSEKFEGLLPIKQHRLIYTALQQQLNEGLHALALNTIKPSKWQK